MNNSGSKNYIAVITEGQNMRSISQKVVPDENKMPINLLTKYGWYDLTITVEGFRQFSRRYAGCVETGKEIFTDPLMS